MKPNTCPKHGVALTRDDNPCYRCDDGIVDDMGRCRYCVGKGLIEYESCDLCADEARPQDDECGCEPVSYGGWTCPKHERRT